MGGQKLRRILSTLGVSRGRLEKGWKISILLLEERRRRFYLWHPPLPTQGINLFIQVCPFKYKALHKSAHR